MFVHVEQSQPSKDGSGCDHTDKHTHRKRSRCTVNRTLLPLKMFYFFFYGACGAVIPFIAVFMKSLHLTVAETGVVTGASVLAAAFLRTGIGVAADKMAARKAFLMISCFGFGTAFFFLWFIPPRTDLALPPDTATYNKSGIGDTKSLPGSDQSPQYWACFSNNGSQLCRYPPSIDHAPCQLVTHSVGTYPHQVSRRAPYQAHDHANDASPAFQGISNLRKKRSDEFFEKSPNPFPYTLQDKPYLLRGRRNTRTPCFILGDIALHSAYTSFNSGDSGEPPLRGRDTDGTDLSGLRVENTKPLIQTQHEVCLLDCRPIFSSVSASTISAQVSVESLLQDVTESVNLTENAGITATDLPSVIQKIPGVKANPDVFRADYAFLVSLILVTTARAFYSSATSLADAVTYTVLGPRSLKWGRQRMWGTVGTALAVLSATNINDHLKGNSYSALFFMCLGLSLLATIVGGVFLRAEKSPKQSNLRSDVTRLLSEAPVRIFLMKLIFYGIMCGTAQNFFLWFLVDLGSNQTTLGLCVAVHCLASVFALRFSSRIFKRISHDTVIRIVLATYVVRFLVFSFLTHAWTALPVEVLHGVTYSLMWASASSTASQMAPPGTQASCQAIAGAAYWDLGRGLGNLLTGQLMQSMGARWTFRSYAGTCVLLLPVFWLLDRAWPISRQQLVLPVSTCEEDFKQDSTKDKGGGTLNQQLLEYDQAPSFQSPVDTRDSGEDIVQPNTPSITDPGELTELIIEGENITSEQLLSADDTCISRNPPSVNPTQNGHAQPVNSENLNSSLLQSKSEVKQGENRKS